MKVRTKARKLRPADKLARRRSLSVPTSTLDAHVLAVRYGNGHLVYYIGLEYGRIGILMINLRNGEMFSIAP